MKAIQVKYLPATNHKPSRWKSWAFGGLTVTKSYDYEFDPAGNARRVAEALLAKMEQHSRKPATISGMGLLPNGDYVFTLGESISSHATAYEFLFRPQSVAEEGGQEDA
jgi:hypothetical protein